MNTLLRYAPISNILDDLFENRRYTPAQSQGSTLRFPVDIVEGENSYELKAELPGLDKKKIQVSVEENVLSISAEREAEKRAEKDRYSHFEREHGKFERAFTLPENVDSSSIEASYVDGILQLNIKKTEASRPRKVEIKVD